MKYVAYRRVSTKEQGSSGLGLAAQMISIEAFVRASGGECLADYVDVQSGRKDSRAGLTEALRCCRVQGATLVVSKLCRLSRSFAYSASLLEGQVPIVICDNPTASMLELRLKAAINQEERERISIRTKEALAAKRLKGDELGNKEVWRYARNQDTTKANEVRSAKAEDYKQYMLAVINAHYGDVDLPSLAAIATWLNESGHKTPRGSDFTRSAVRRILQADKSQSS